MEVVSMGENSSITNSLGETFEFSYFIKFSSEDTEIVITEEDV